MAETNAGHHLDAGGEPGRPRRGLLLGGLVVVLVALVGLGSRAPLWDIGGPPRVADPSNYSGDLLLIGVALAGVLLFVIPLMLSHRRAVEFPDPDVPRLRPKWWIRILSVLALAAAVGISLFVLTLLPGASKKHPTQLAQVTTPEKLALRHAAPPVHWWGYTLLAVIVVAGVATGLYLRRPHAVSRPDDEEPDQLLAAVDLSLEDIENDPDPRRAVIRAYGRMESALGSYGLQRRLSETPLEYIGRSLTSLRVGRASVERLSELFERAKFSRHEIDLSMKSDALAALGALRDELVRTHALQATT